MLVSTTRPLAESTILRISPYLTDQLRKGDKEVSRQYIGGNLGQLSRTFNQSYEEDWKPEDFVYGSKGQNHPQNSSWCKLPQFISYKGL